MCMYDCLDSKPLHLVGLYSSPLPPEGEMAHVESITTLLACHPQDTYVIGADFNSIVNMNMDRSHPPLLNALERRLAEKLVTWVREWDLLD